MVEKISVVIGANYGDEGKGLVTDALVDKYSTLNVLTNGGAQRGHTVVTPDGFRHVFHHFGSGTFKGATTYFPSSFIVNPVLFVQEVNELQSLEKQIMKNRGCSYEIGSSKYFSLNLSPIINPNCIVTTPWDMLVNRIVSEEITGTNTCGIGVWETIVRNRLYAQYTFRDFKTLSYSQRKEVVLQIREWCAKRLKSYYGLDIPERYKDSFYSVNLVNNFLGDFDYMADCCMMSEPYFPNNYKHVIFENAQGLMLSNSRRMESEYLTPSYTGAESVIPYIHEIVLNNDIENNGARGVSLVTPSINLYYVSRPYLTRHGKDEHKFGNAKSVNPIANIVDMTNVPNEYQGEIGYKTFDVYGLLGLTSRINEDANKFKLFSHGCTVNTNFVLTHTNEIYDMGLWYNYLENSGKLSHLNSETKFTDVYFSYDEYGIFSYKFINHSSKEYTAKVFHAEHTL